MLTLIKKSKVFIGTIMLIFFILASSYSTFAVVEPTSDFYVNDYANVLSNATEQYIINANVDLNNKTKAQIVVVTVNDLEGKSIETYATELFRKFGIGDKNLNNGVLLLCSTGDRMFRVEVGYGLEGALPDGKTGRIQDEYIIPYLRDDNYDEGIKNGFSAVLKEVCKEYDITIPGAETAQKGQSIEDKQSTFTGIFIISMITSIILKGIIEERDKKNKSIIKIVYVIFVAVISFIILRIFSLAIIITIFNTIFIFRSRRKRTLWRRTLRRRRLFWWRFLEWRRLFWRRRIFWWWRKLKKLLKYENNIFLE